MSDSWELYDSYQDALAVYEGAQQRLEELATQIAEQITAEDMDLLWHLYWNTEIKAMYIANALGVSMGKMAAMLQPGPSVACGGCGLSITARSRSARREILHPPKHWWSKHCPRCGAEGRKRRDEEHARLYGTAEDRQRREQRAAQRLHDLKTMPYKEFLRTPEWDAVRKAAMRRAGYKCQLCGASDVRLNVHHNTYVRRGEERNADVISLCEDCHAKHHDKQPHA